ncbi:hypothetical protein C5167_035995 [Papaver somniferum]|nr:hypothetical protein C5167_035995 [Papaver somniferum]
MIIVQYIDDVWASAGHSIIPSDPYDASIARFWATYIDDKFFPSLFAIAKSKDEEERKAAIEQVIAAAIEQVIAAFGILEEAYQKTSKGKDFFGGEKIGYIDISFESYVGWIKASEKMNGIKLFDETKAPGLTKWADKFCADESVKSVMPEADALIEKKNTDTVMAGSESEEVKILGGWPAWPSPFVMRARVALNIKSVKYEFLEQPYGTKSELLLKSNPIYKKVPVMIHGDKPICESMNIVQYIDDVYWRSTKLMSATTFLFFPSMSGITKCKDGEEYTAVIEQMIAAFGLLEQAYQEISKGKDFFGGEKIGYIDIAFGCYIGSIKVTEKMNGIKLHHETKAPGLTKWADKFCADDRVKPVDFITRRFTAGNRSSHGVC